MANLFIGMIIGGILFFGGFFSRDIMKKESVTNIQNIENKTDVLNKTDSKQTQLNGQIQLTLLNNNGLTNINIDFKDFTNLYINLVKSSNYLSITNTN